MTHHDANDAQRGGLRLDPLARLTLHVDEDTANRLKNAAAALGRSLASVLVQAVVNQVQELEQRNGGQPYPPRKSLPERLRGVPVASK